MSAARSVLACNRQALELFDPRAAASLKRLPEGTPAADAEADPALPLPAARAGDTVVLLGLGDGSIVRRLLDLPGVRLLVVESLSAASLGALYRQDFSAALSAGRLRLLLLPVASPVPREISLRECIVEVIARAQDDRLHFVATAGTAPQEEFFSALCQGMENWAGSAEEFARAGTPEPAYDVTVVSPCCVIFDDLARCFHRLGVRVQLLRVPDERKAWTPEQVRAARLSLAQAPSRLVVTRNRALLETWQPTDCPQPESMIAGPVAAWWWDVPNLASHIEQRYPRGGGRAFAFARDILPLLPQGAQWLPPGARTPFVEAGAQAEVDQDIEVSFVGQSRLLDLHANLRNLKSVLADLGAPAAALSRDMERLRGYGPLHAYLSTRRREISDGVATLARAFPAHAYYLDYLLEMVVSGAFRLAAIERLAGEGIPFRLYGDDDWRRVPGVGEGNFMGLCAPEDLPLLYRRSRVNLNLNFMQVSSTVNPKVLDVAAAGGVVLTDHRPELELLYPDPAVRPFAFTSLDELVDRIRVLQQADLGRHRRAVRAHTCAHHTLQHRAQWLLGHFGLLPAEP